MSFPSRFVFALSLIAMLLAIGLSFGSHRGDLDPIPVQQDADQRARDAIMKRWDSTKGVSLKDGPELLKAIRRIPANECLKNSTKARLIQPSALPPASHDDLIHALGQFLLCYSSEVPQGSNSLLELISARKQRLSKETVEQLRKLLIHDAGKSKAELASKTGPEILEMYLEALQCERPMSELLVEESCLLIREVKRIGNEQSEERPAWEDHRLWQNQITFRNLSEADRTPEQEASSRGSILTAHARLLVRHDPEHLAISFPYHLELWYDTTEKAWHLYALECFPSSMGKAVRIVF